MLVSQTIQLRAIEEEDLLQIVQWRNLPEVNAYFYEFEPLSLTMQERWFSKFLGSTDKMWIVETIDEKKLLGTVSIYNIDMRSRKAEWGRLYLVGDVRSKGYGKEVSQLIYDYCFNHLNLNKLSCEVFADNVSVVEMHKKVGNKVEGTLRQHVYRFGKYQDIVRLSILKEEWLENNPNKDNN